MGKVRVNLTNNSYNIFVSDGIFENLQEHIKINKLYKNVLCVIDKNVYTLYKKEIKKAFSPPPSKFAFLCIESKESKKSLSALSKIYSSLVVGNYGRDTLLIAIGGGIVGDVAGFAAATYSRGIQYIHIPTTLLAAVDSSVGGKTGINFGSTKNIVGAFHQPKLVLIDTHFLSTLPPRERISGIGEIVKYAFLINGDFFKYVDKNLEKIINLDKKVLSKVITESVKYKAAIVINDEKEESGLRKMLNLGHTFGHAIEVESGHRLKHGEAVIVGLVCALFLSYRLGFLNERNLVTAIIFIKRVSKNILIKRYDQKKILNLMKRDKKSKDEVYKFVLLKDFGKVLIDIEADIEAVKWSLKNGIKIFS